MDTTNGTHMAFDRVREHTAPHINARMDADMAARISQYAGRDYASISDRIVSLEHEWDIERVLETNASLFAFTGLVLGLTINRSWLVLTGAVLMFLFQHAIQGWCSPLALFRRMNIRTRREIDREKQALKALRGDFDGLPATAGAQVRAGAALLAAYR